LTQQNLTESWHDIQQVKEESQKMFELGLLNLDVKGRVETMFWRIAETCRRSPPSSIERGARRAAELSKQLVDQHICKLLVFQSLLDHWALGALFPTCRFTA